jgi:hypothetical protein
MANKKSGNLLSTPSNAFALGTKGGSKKSGSGMKMGKRCK